ncbi:TPA: hypothetical protein ACGW3W_002258 [Pseudomonas aeruginosa]
MIWPFLALLLLPTLAITLWHLVLTRMSPRVWGMYRITGMVGVPVHELAHAIACVVFGLRITGMALYAPDPVTGSLGYVHFRYHPTSPRQVLGLLIQGVAPMLLGGGIAMWVLHLPVVGALPDQDIAGMWRWGIDTVWSVLKGIAALASGGTLGALAAAVVLLISLHSIPSYADVRLGLRGAILVGVPASLVVGLLQIFHVNDGPGRTSIGAALGGFLTVIEAGLWGALSGALAVVTLAVLAGVLLIVLPVAVSATWSLLRGVLRS